MQKTITKTAGSRQWRGSTFQFLLAAYFLLLASATAFGQKQMENLGRGVVAVRTSTSEVYIGWRLLGTDPSGIGFNIYRGTTKLNSTPITSSTNYVDNISTNSTYTVRPVINGVEQTASSGATVWSQQYLTINLQRPAGGTTPTGEAYTYSPNDCSPGDLDGDGEYDIVVLWTPSNAKDNSQSGYTGNVYIDGYKLDGTRLWRIDLGRNIRAGAHYTQLMVFDLDGDGKAEVACKTADGTKSGTGQVIGSSTADYRNSNGYVLSGPEFLTVFSGQTGAALATKDYIPARGTVSSWGDSYGNRVDRFISTIAYLDGSRPSLIMGRGYYTRLVRAAWDFRNGTLTNRWTFDSNNSGNSAYYGQGNHQMTVGDSDGDGRDEIFNGSSAINDNGSGLWSTGLGHGDALHMSDINPDRPGQEVWMCHEEASSNGGIGLSLTDAKTGSLIWNVPGTGDIGRAMTSDIDSRYKGMEVWGSTGGGVYSCTGTLISSTKPTINWGLWWDGDLQREILDGTKLDKWNAGSISRLFTFYNYGGAKEINGTKANPNFSADILGDWREEVVYRSYDDTKLLVFTTVIPAANRFYTFMHDPQYRCQVAQQTSAYNQPPHTGFYFGGGMATPPTPNIYLTGTTISGTFKMLARHSGKALDVYQKSVANGGNIVQWTYNGGNNQKWVVSSVGGGYYKIINLNSGLALDVAAGSLADGGNVIQYAYNGGTNQQWAINDLGNGYYSIINRKSGKALDIDGGSTADGANAWQWTYLSGTNQQFSLNAVSSTNGVLGISDSQTLELTASVSSSPVVYPNPSTSRFNLQVPGKFKFTIADQLGKEVEKGQGEDKIEVGNNLTPGVYFITIQSNDKVETFKAIKQ